MWLYAGFKYKILFKTNLVYFSFQLFYILSFKRKLIFPIFLNFHWVQIYIGCCKKGELKFECSKTPEEAGDIPVIWVSNLRNYREYRGLIDISAVMVWIIWMQGGNKVWGRWKYNLDGNFYLKSCILILF